MTLVFAKVFEDRPFRSKEAVDCNIFWSKSNIDESCILVPRVTEL